MNGHIEICGRKFVSYFLSLSTQYLALGGNVWLFILQKDNCAVLAAVDGHRGGQTNMRSELLCPQ